MANIRAKLALKNIGKSRSEKEALLKANYSPSYAKSGQIKKTKAWKEMVDKFLPDDLLMKVHLEGLAATRPIPEGEGYFPDYKVRGEYLDKGYKIKDKYAAEKHINLNIPVPLDPDVQNERIQENKELKEKN